MYKVTAVCSKCKKEETQLSKSSYGPNFSHGIEGWERVELKVSDYNKRGYLFCKGCLKELGLYIENDKGDRAKTNIETIEERLFNVICEIVAGELENRG